MPMIPIAVANRTKLKLYPLVCKVTLEECDVLDDIVDLNMPTVQKQP